MIAPQVVVGRRRRGCYGARQQLKCHCPYSFAGAEYCQVLIEWQWSAVLKIWARQIPSCVINTYRPMRRQEERTELEKGDTASLRQDYIWLFREHALPQVGRILATFCWGLKFKSRKLKQKEKRKHTAHPLRNHQTCPRPHFCVTRSASARLP